jgi:hypothetical protein
MIRAGSTVRFAKMPEWVAALPDESRRVFEFCLGRTYRIAGKHYRLNSPVQTFVKELAFLWDTKIAIKRAGDLSLYIKNFVSALTKGA